MILHDILESDLSNCRKAFDNDERLHDINKEFYDLLENMDNLVKIKLEDLFSAYAARITRIAYAQGLKDFNELCLILKKDISEII